MSLNLACFNVKGLKDPSKCVLALQVKVAVVQETHFIYAENSWMLGNNFVVLSVFGNHCNARMSQLIRHSLNAIVNLVFADDGNWLVVADVAIKSFALARF